MPTSGTLSGLNVTVAPGASIAGIVDHSGTGASIDSVAVTAVSDQGISYVTTTAANGSYQFSGLPAGTYALTAGGGSFDYQTQSGLTLTSNQSATAVNFNLDDAATLDGVVVQMSNGTPVGQATVLLVDTTGANFSATTDATGAFSIGNLHPGAYSITVTSDGFATGQANATLGAGSSTTVPDILLATGASVTVTVTDTTSAPVASADVQLMQNGSDVTEGGTDSTGKVTLTGLAAGAYQLVVSAGDFLGTTDTVVTAAGQTLARSYQLQPAGEIKGKVTDGGGNPLANVPLFLLDQNGSQQIATTGARR